MEQTLQKLGELLFGAIPTGILLLLLYIFYHVILHKPLEAVLAERRRRTEGAVEKARADIARAAARTAEYETKLRDARLSIFRSLDQRRKQAMDARSAAVAQARERAQELIAQAKADIDSECAAARSTLETDSERLANRIIETLLPGAGQGPAAVVGGR
jgi:F-type H+-transporting ATPase subunit b